MSIFPLNTGKNEATNKGTIKHTVAGINTYSTNLAALTLFFTQSIVVVTSPIGDQAPPALAAITMREAYQMRSFWSGMSLRTMVMRIMVVVRLSIIEERKKAIMPIIQSNFTLLLVRITRLMISNPRCISMISTMVIAPIKKKRISAVSAK